MSGWRASFWHASAQEAVAVSDLAIQKKATYIPAVIAQVGRSA
jgi:hypothetical protein